MHRFRNPFRWLLTINCFEKPIKANSSALPMEFELAAKRYNLDYFGVVYGVLRDYYILSKGNDIKVFIDEWVDISNGKIEKKLLQIDGPYSGDLAKAITLDDVGYKEMDRLVTFIHSNSAYKGYGIL